MNGQVRERATVPYSDTTSSLWQDASLCLHPSTATLTSSLSLSPQAITSARGLEEVPKQIDLNSETEFSISLPDSSSSRCPVRAELKSLLEGSSVECKVTESPGGPGRYRVSVLPACRGRHELTITAAGVLVEGCPVKILVHCAPQLLGRPVKVIEGVSRPAGVALRGDTELVVTETEPAAVCVRDRRGKVIKSFEQESPQLDNPYGVAVDTEGSVYVAELINCRIHKFSRDGATVRVVEGEVAFPAGLKISHDDQVYVCDDANKKVHVFDKNLDRLFSFGESGEAPGNFQSPSDLAFDLDGNVFVVDTKRERVMKFSPQGEFFTEFEMKGKSSELELGICVGPSGQLFVSDFWNHRVVVFDPTGQFLTTFGRKGAEPGEFDTPAGIAVDEDGFVYVCDQMNSRIQVF